MAQKIEDVVLTLELGVAEVNVILASLAKQPLESVVAVWAKVKQVAEAQLAEMDIEDQSANDND
jgi:hypothetical protein